MLAGLNFSTQVNAVELLTVRRATHSDVPEIVALFAGDSISASRGDSTETSSLVYERSFDAVMANDSNDIVVAVDPEGALVATLQLTRIPGMVRGGATRLMVEAMFVARAARSRGVGTALMRWVVDAAAPSVRADLVQLTSDATRVDAHRFDERLGFAASHLGFKMAVSGRMS